TMDCSSHCATSSKRHIRPEWGISLRISALLIGGSLAIRQTLRQGIHVTESRCEDASHSQSTSCEIYRRRLFRFAQAFGVRARPRAAFNSAPFRPPRHDLMGVALF